MSGEHPADKKATRRSNKYAAAMFGLVWGACVVLQAAATETTDSVRDNLLLSREAREQVVLFEQQLLTLTEDSLRLETENTVMRNDHSSVMWGIEAMQEETLNIRTEADIGFHELSEMLGNLQAFLPPDRTAGNRAPGVTILRNVNNNSTYRNSAGHTSKYYVEGSEPKSVFNEGEKIRVFDADDDDITSATVVMDRGYTAGDVMMLRNGTGWLPTVGFATYTLINPSAGTSNSLSRAITASSSLYSVDGTCEGACHEKCNPFHLPSSITQKLWPPLAPVLLLCFNGSASAAEYQRVFSRVHYWSR
jgi:hypothetical protein